MRKCTPLRIGLHHPCDKITFNLKSVAGCFAQANVRMEFEDGFKPESFKEAAGGIMVTKSNQGSIPIPFKGAE